MQEFINFGLVALGGACGAATRYGTTRIAKHLFDPHLPVATLIVNVFGCLLIGLAVGGGMHHRFPSGYLIFAVGFLGALTTFSAFGAETMKHLQNGEWIIALLNVLLNVSFSIIAAGVGVGVASRFFD